MQFDAMKNSGECNSDVDRTAHRPGGAPPRVDFDDVLELMKRTQWCGCGAVPGANLAPTSACCNVPVTQRDRTAVRPMTLPGYGIGPHGLELGVTEGMPDVSADYPLIYQLPDSSFNLDPMDSNMWDPPTTKFGGTKDPWAPWGYGSGPKV
jgi:hypothetical protein